MARSRVETIRLLLQLARVNLEQVFVKRFTSGDELTQFIPKTIVWIGPKEKL